MAPGKKAPLRATVVLRPLKNCLVNLPSSLVDILLNSNTVCTSESSSVFFTDGGTADSECHR